MHRLSKTIITTLAVLLLASITNAQDLKLAQVFADHMVLQHGQKAPIWGWAKPDSQITIKFMDQTLNATTNANGKWKSALTALTISAEPAQLTISSGKQTLTVKDILVGDVWLCSGQSNMQWNVGNSNDAANEIKNANHPLIRHFAVTRDLKMFETETFKGAQWTICSPKTVGQYTAVGYFFGRHLQQKLNIPIGLLHSSWGGTRIEPWVPRVGFKNVQQTKGIYNALMLKDPTSQSYKKQSLNTWKIFPSGSHNPRKHSPINKQSRPPSHSPLRSSPTPTVSLPACFTTP